MNDSMIGLTAEDVAKRVEKAKQAPQQTFTRPTTLYGEPREEITQAPMHFQEEAEEAAKVYDADRPHLSQADASLTERLGKAPWGDVPWPATGWVSPTEVERMAERHRQELEAAAIPEVAVATLGELIDRISIVNVKIYHLEDIVRDSHDTEKACNAARQTRALNRERSDLKNAITRAVQGAGARLDVKLGG